ncbi:threonylcarbamoyl-AMP synthase [Candidatus Poribacteria bacterium]|nr:threonylcarbamoyl-AMP synthase [Candidatus Poribacteria bacterium]MYB01186.1 threonylcarbamoyl-AMP synthase [Candidatus Poribacteria bacterium]
MLESDVCIEAVQCLKSGGIIAIPTDTVYGLGADPFNPDAVQKLYTCKGRPDGKPIPLVLSSVDDVYRVAQNLPDYFFHLTDRFWPGGLTIIVEAKDLLPVLTAGGNTVGVRIPDNPLLLKILKTFGGPAAITSANLSGEPPATAPQEIGAELASRIDVIVDGGKTPGPIPSTVYDISVSPPLIRRHGVISEETLAKELACYNKL